MATRQTPKSVEEFLTNVRKKSLRQLVKEDRAAGEEKPEVKEKPEEPIEKVEKKEEKKPEIKEEPKAPQVNAEELIAKAAAETADKVATEIRKIDADKRLSEETKERKKDELRAKWSGVDVQTGKQTPKDYDEIVAESRRLAYEDFKEFYREQKQAELEEIKKAQSEEESRKERENRDYQEKLTNLNQRIQEEMEELYSAGKLDRPKDINDTSEPAARKVKDLFDQAIKENEKRKVEGKPLVDSIAKFYFMYYKPGEDNQPAGEEAPIAGNKAAPPESPDRFNYARDIRGKTFKQILYEGRRKLQQIGK